MGLRMNVPSPDEVAENLVTGFVAVGFIVTLPITLPVIALGWVIRKVAAMSPKGGA